jgi:hypothetical protein
MASFSTKNWTPREHFEWRLENLKGAIKLAEVSIQALILTNGAAAAGLLTFFGSVVVKPAAFSSAARGELAAALALFGAGVASAIICAIFAYFAQRGRVVIDDPTAARSLTVPAMIFAVLSVACFVFGLYSAATALT